MWIREQTDVNAFRVTCEIKKNRDWEAWALLSADRHWDNPKSLWDLQKEHLELAKERSAIVIDAGDFFCCMQGKYDKRSSKSAVRPEHQGDDYLDSLVETAAEFFKPYRDNMLLIGGGNHESSIKSRHETDLIERLVSQLNVGKKTKVYNGHFGGYVSFWFTFGKLDLSRGGGNRSVNKINLKYVHGWGGGGPITQDMIAQSRRAMMYPDADIILTGHTHDSWVMDRQVEKLSTSGKISLMSQTAIKTPTYKEEYGTGKGGWHVETGKPPKPVGAYWLRFFFSHKLNQVDYEVIRAK
jgi:hypothetical protein